MQKNIKSIITTALLALVLVVSGSLNSRGVQAAQNSSSGAPAQASSSETPARDSSSEAPAKPSSSDKSAAAATSSKEEHKHSGGIATCSQRAVCEVCGQEYGELDPDNHVTEEKSDERTHYEECTLCHKKLNREPHRGGTATPTKLAVCDVCGASYGSLDSEHLVVEVPAAFSTLIYNGKPQEGVPEGIGYHLDHNIETNAGSYVTTVTLEEGNEWSDGTTGVKEIAWTIQRSGVTVHVKDYTLSYGEKDPEAFPVEYRGLIEGDQIVYEITREEGQEIGTYRLNITGESKQENYHVNFAPGKLTIQPLELTPGITVHNKWFDGTTQADLIIDIAGVNGDTLAIEGLTGEFEDGQVGADKTVHLDTSKMKILLNGEAVNAADLKNYVITIPETVIGKIQGPYIGVDGEGSQKEESSAEESISEESGESSEEVSEESGEPSSENSGEVAGDTSDSDSAGSSEDASAGNDSGASAEDSAESQVESSSEESGSESTGESEEESSQNTQEVIRQLTSGDNWTLISFVFFSLLGCFIAGIILAWKAENENKN